MLPNILHLDCSSGYMTLRGVKIDQTIHFKGVNFIGNLCKLCFNKSDLKPHITKKNITLNLISKPLYS